jgi:hypothetical protein
MVVTMSAFGATDFASGQQFRATLLRLFVGFHAGDFIKFIFMKINNLSDNNDVNYYLRRPRPAPPGRAFARIIRTCETCDGACCLCRTLPAISAWRNSPHSGSKLPRYYNTI